MATATENRKRYPLSTGAEAMMYYCHVVAQEAKENSFSYGDNEAVIKAYRTVAKILKKNNLPLLIEYLKDMPPIFNKSWVISFIHPAWWGLMNFSTPTRDNEQHYVAVFLERLRTYDPLLKDTPKNAAFISY